MRQTEGYVESPRLMDMQGMAKAIACPYLEVFKDAGHSLFVDLPHLFKRSLKAFIERL